MQRWMIDLAVAVGMAIATLVLLVAYAVLDNSGQAGMAAGGMVEEIVPFVKSHRLAMESKQICFNQKRGQYGERSAYAEAFCSCAANPDAVSPYQRFASATCDQRAYESLASHADLDWKFATEFDNFCNKSATGGRQTQEQVDQYCGCMKKRVALEPKRMAAYAFGEGEARGSAALADDIKVCQQQIPNRLGYGWQFTALDGKTAALLRYRRIQISNR